MTSKFIIYALIDPRTNEVRYIGKSSTGLRRPERHARPGSLAKDGTWKARWIRKLQAEGATYRIEVLEEVDRERLSLAEIEWIAKGRALGWPLTNLTDGGDGMSGFRFSEETRRKISERLKGKRLSDATKELVAAANRGKKASEETRKKMSDSAKARVNNSQSERMRLATLRLGAKNSDACREKLRIANLGAKHSPERRAINSLVHRGTRHSEETKAKMRASHRARLDRMSAA